MHFCTSPQVCLPDVFTLLGGAAGAKSSCPMWNTWLRDGKLWLHLERPGQELGLEDLAKQRDGKRGLASGWVARTYSGLLEEVTDALQ